MKKAIIFILIGAALIAGVIATGSYGLSEDNIHIYEQAVALEKGNSNLGFEGFAMTDYPVAFYDGDHDYVIVWENGGYNIVKRKAVINSIAAAAYCVDGHYEVLAPAVEKMSSLLKMMTTGSAEYGREECVATLWHEAFHCWQLTNYYDNIEAICSGEAEENLIAEYADTNPQAVALFERQAALLENAVKTDDIDMIREYIAEYKKLDEQRKALFSGNITALEEYYTRVEGTACYVEACVYQMQLPEKFCSAYIDHISEYGKGSNKYYKSGMAQCMILDTLNPQWKESYDFSEPLINLIYQELGLACESLQ